MKLPNEGGAAPVGVGAGFSSGAGLPDGGAPGGVGGGLPLGVGAPLPVIPLDLGDYDDLAGYGAPGKAVYIVKNNHVVISNSEIRLLHLRDFDDGCENPHIV